MGILELKVGDKVYTNPKKINDILLNYEFYWLIDSELLDAVLEIQKDTLIWHSGIFMTGNWKYGIFKNGGFYGVFENGIFEDGYFDGFWKSGINLKNN
jgi:hypothetical protein